MPLAISDQGLVGLLRLAEPLAPDDRGLFLQDIATALAGHCGLIGDGLLHRTAAEMQRRYLKPIETRSAPQPYFNGRKKATAAAG